MTWFSKILEKSVTISNISSEEIPSILHDSLAHWWENTDFFSLYMLGSFTTGEFNRSYQKSLSDIDFLAIVSSDFPLDKVPEIRQDFRRFWKKTEPIPVSKVGLRVRTIEELPAFRRRMISWGYDIDQYALLFFGQPCLKKPSQYIKISQGEVIVNLIERLWCDVKFSELSNNNSKSDIYTWAHSILDVLHLLLVQKDIYKFTHQERIQWTMEHLVDIPISFEVLQLCLDIKLGRRLCDNRKLDYTRAEILDQVWLYTLKKPNVDEFKDEGLEMWGIDKEDCNSDFLRSLIKNLDPIAEFPNLPQDHLPLFISVSVLLFSFFQSLDRIRLGKPRENDVEVADQIAFKFIRPLALRVSVTFPFSVQEDGIWQYIQALENFRLARSSLARRDWA